MPSPGAWTREARETRTRTFRWTQLQAAARTAEMGKWGRKRWARDCATKTEACLTDIGDGWFEVWGATCGALCRAIELYSDHAVGQSVVGPARRPVLSVGDGVVAGEMFGGRGTAVVPCLQRFKGHVFPMIGHGNDATYSTAVVRRDFEGTAVCFFR